MIWRTLLLLIALFNVTAQAQEVFDRPDPLDENIKTGVAVGEKIPEFEALDQNGKRWDFEAIKGPGGAVLLFFRSADW